MPKAVKQDPTEVLKATLATQGRGVNVSDLAEHLVSAFGGSEQFAEELHGEYTRAKAGSIARSRALESIMRLVGQANSIHKDRNKGADAAQMSDDELVDAVRDLLGRRAASEAPAGPPPEPGAADG